MTCNKIVSGETIPSHEDKKTLWVSYIHFLSKIFFMIKWTYGFLFLMRSYRQRNIQEDLQQQNQILILVIAFTLLQQIAESCWFVYVCVTFLLPRGIKGLKEH